MGEGGGLKKNIHRSKRAGEKTLDCTVRVV